MSLPTVAWVGLGAMGRPLAGNLARASSVVQKCLVWNRCPIVSSEHQGKYGTFAFENLEDLAAQGADILFTCLPTSQIVMDNVDIMLPHLKPGTTLVDTTSGSPKQTREIGARLASVGVNMIDAPVSGGPAGAAAGQLSVIVGGDDAVLKKVYSCLEVFAKGITHVGPLGAGHAVKSVNNILNVSQLIMVSEGMAALCKQGIDPVKALEAINISSGRSLATEVRFPDEVLTRNFNYNFKLSLMQKDVAVATEMFDDYFPSAELLRITPKIMQESVEKYGEDADYTEVAKLIEERAGVIMKPK